MHYSPQKGAFLILKDIRSPGIIPEWCLRICLEKSKATEWKRMTGRMVLHSPPGLRQVTRGPSSVTKSCDAQQVTQTQVYSGSNSREGDVQDLGRLTRPLTLWASSKVLIAISRQKEFMTEQVK